MNIEFFDNPWIWLAVTLLTLGLCTFLPIRIKNDELRRAAMWFILIPASLAIIMYVYPYGLEVFRRLAVGD